LAYHLGSNKSFECRYRRGGLGFPTWLVCTFSRCVFFTEQSSTLQKVLALFNWILSLSMHIHFMCNDVFEEIHYCKVITNLWNFLFRLGLVATIKVFILDVCTLLLPLMVSTVSLKHPLMNMALNLNYHVNKVCFLGISRVLPGNEPYILFHPDLSFSSILKMYRHILMKLWYMSIFLNLYGSIGIKWLVFVDMIKSHVKEWDCNIGDPFFFDSRCITCEGNFNAWHVNRAALYLPLRYDW
jgi:hypothetical protein